ncbi:hypothetical protein Aab01nite_31740 [Paractinoplanes abujensis]|uniref:Uncharacterized protein n=1 Tax=Paractinoplanes abujensis TaxID=882441 RepID=A0A7W7D072_9ACTN|nr:hypothetical protein [Actinoplanes abujensis]MBB4697934.1 hypothetical protein [Actinoplanes abujensis]GID19584.1 hypothetical protein Aab01nite_31740 [Actinoplanes abujensis]
MAGAFAAFPILGSRRRRLALTLGVVLLLAVMPVLISRALQSSASVRITVVDLRDPPAARDAALASLLREERRHSDVLILLTPGGVPSRSCSKLPLPRYCPAINDFPTIGLSRAGSATAAVTLAYGDGAAPADRGLGVYAASRTTRTGAGLLSALLVAFVLALGVACLVVAPEARAEAARARPSRTEPQRTRLPRAEPPPRPRPASKVPAATREFRLQPAAGDIGVCRSHFGPDGGYVCFGGVLVVWAEMVAHTVVPVPGDRLQVVGTDPDTGELHVTAVASHPAAH